MQDVILKQHNAVCWTAVFKVNGLVTKISKPYTSHARALQRMKKEGKGWVCLTSVALTREHMAKSVWVESMGKTLLVGENAR
jgi:hypothetical protein